MHPSVKYRQKAEEILAKYHKHDTVQALYNLTYMAEGSPNALVDLQAYEDLRWLEYDSLPHERNHLRLVE